MAVNESLGDIENHLDNFIVRKKKPEEKTACSAKSGPKIHENVPLTLWDILRVTQDPDREKVYIISGAVPIYFRTCIVYGFVAGFGTHNDFFNKYIIDDSTGSLEASIPKKHRDRDVISSLYNEVSSLTSNEANKPVVESCIRLLKLAMQFIDPSPIKRGDNLILRGRPNIFRGMVGLDAFSFFIDSGRSRKMEICFADNVIDWHKEYKNQNKTKK
ncbi:uncharacterized protein LOC108107771 [Drosophila eugracilis]|uniref:uncharacterized protein LOC108107771 n=1 Tax=Drosophila eugracilis TaxID=29029 RepID=UPI0007E7A7C2|nr:uncharacterized protein LOC108107771 [Drosophila eugracilis]